MTRKKASSRQIDTFTILKCFFFVSLLSQKILLNCTNTSTILLFLRVECGWRRAGAGSGEPPSSCRRRGSPSCSWRTGVPASPGSSTVSPSRTSRTVGRCSRTADYALTSQPKPELGNALLSNITSPPPPTTSTSRGQYKAVQAILSH